MSLINDALKQATRSPRSSAVGAAASSAGALRPVEEPRSGGGSSVALPIALVVVLAAAGWFLWQWWQSGKAGTPFNLTSLVQSAKSLIPNSKPVADAKSESNSGSAAAATKPENAKSEGNFITRVFNKQPSAADPSRPVVFPPVKVQGIYYRVGDSTVLINGKNLNEGEAIDGVTIAKIDRQTVTLEFQGQTKEIKLR